MARMVAVGSMSMARAAVARAQSDASGGRSQPIERVSQETRADRLMSETSSS